jgi:hypothetical protein
VDFVLVGVCVLVVLLAVAVTAIWQRQGRLETRVAALEDEVGVAWAEQSLPGSLIKRVLTLEVLFELRRRPRPRHQ